MRKIDLEQYGDNGYMMYRIPGIVVSPTGTVLAYYEGRAGEGDWTKQDIFVCRSEDEGKTWSERTLLVEGDDAVTLHNACMIADAARGLVHFIWHRNYNQAFYQRSADDGLSWSEPSDITYVFERFRSEYDWNVIATGPGHGITLRNGRLFAPVWLSDGGQLHRPSVVSGIFSDDGGATWERGDIIHESDWFKMPNETTAVELATGEVLMNMRHESDAHYRAVAVSGDGGKRWSEPALDRQLPDPVCFGALARLAGEERHGFGGGVLFVNCAFDGGDRLVKKQSPDGSMAYWSGRDVRINLTVRLSLDECRSWTYARQLEAFGGYADIAASPDGRTIYCFYERGWAEGANTRPKTLCVAVFRLDWLRETAAVGDGVPR